VLDVDLGFQPERAAALRIDPNATYKTQEQKNAYFTEALHGVLDVPGIEAAGLSDALPLGRNRNWGIAAKGMIYTPQTYSLWISSHHQRRILSSDGHPVADRTGFYRA